MATDVKLSSEFTIIYGGEVIAYCTDFTLEKNKEIIDITKLGDIWKNKKVDTKDFSVSFNGMVTRGDTVTASLWDSSTAYSSGDYVVLAGKAWEAQGSTTGDNPTTDDGTNWLETSIWLVGTTYAADDLVYITSVAQENRIYKSLQGSNTGNDPLTETAYWERLETNYEALLKELQNNDTEVLCTIKPSATTETYYYGNGVLTSLSASIAQGDKATFSGSFQGSGELAVSTGIVLVSPIGWDDWTDSNQVDDWAALDSNTIQETGGFFEVTYVDSQEGANRQLRAIRELGFDLTDGLNYRLRIGLRQTSGTGAQFRLYKGASYTDLMDMTSEWVDYDIDFTKEVGTYCTFVFRSMNSGDVVQVDKMELYTI
jgi:chitodextrinase